MYQPEFGAGKINFTFYSLPGQPVLRLIAFISGMWLISDRSVIVHRSFRAMELLEPVARIRNGEADLGKCLTRSKADHDLLLSAVKPLLHVVFDCRRSTYVNRRVSCCRTLIFDTISLIPVSACAVVDHLQPQDGCG